MFSSSARTAKRGANSIPASHSLMIKCTASVEVESEFAWSSRIPVTRALLEDRKFFYLLNISLCADGSLSDSSVTSTIKGLHNKNSTST